MYSDNFRCFQMCSVNAGNNRIISNNFIKTQGKIGECVSTVPAFIHADSVQHEKYSTARERNRIERYTI